MNERIRELKEKYLANLYKQLEAAYSQKSYSLSDVDKVMIQERITKLEQDIKEKESELEKFEIKTSPIQMHTHWDEHLPHIDFRTATQWFKRVVDQFHEEGGAAAFFLQDSNTMGGQWLVKRMHASLSLSTPIDFKPFPIVFQSYEHLTKSDFLKKIGERLGIQSPNNNDWDLYSLQIIERICQSLQSGSIVFIEIELRQNLAQREDFISWFVRDFWVKLLRSWHMAPQQLPFIKLIAVIIANTPVPPTCFQHLRCTCEQFKSEQILELPLDRWSEDDIRTWLFRYTKLTGPPHHLKTEEIKDMARSIYASSDNGLPSSVHLALLREFEYLTRKAQV